MAKQLWGEDRITYQRPDGSPRSVPVSWTDALPTDPYMSVGRGRSLFRVEDLLALAELLTGRRKS